VGDDLISLQSPESAASESFRQLGAGLRAALGRLPANAGKGNVIVVSHDRYFLNRICTAILGFEGDGVVSYAVGNYDYYLEKRAGVETSSLPSSNNNSAASRAATPKPRKLKWKEERELEGMEAAILAAEGEVVRLEKIFAAPDFYAKHAADWQQLEGDLRAARDRMAQLYARWEALSARAG
jgi:ATP-binding cassette subfamily F protein uup